MVVEGVEVVEAVEEVDAECGSAAHPLELADHLIDEDAHLLGAVLRVRHVPAWGEGGECEVVRLP